MWYSRRFPLLTLCLKVAVMIWQIPSLQFMYYDSKAINVSFWSTPAWVLFLT